MKLASNDGSFRATQFALGDDEIDYTLYNVNHPSGSAYFGEAIEQTPLLEAFTDASQMMSSRLVTLPRGTTKLPVISLGVDPIILKQGANIPIQPQTLNYGGTSSMYEANGYILTVHDSRLLSSLTGLGVTDSTLTNVVNSTGDINSKTVVGTTFSLTTSTTDNLFGNSNQLTTTVTVTGRDSGATITVGLVVQKR